MRVCVPINNIYVLDEKRLKETTVYVFNDC